MKLPSITANFVRADNRYIVYQADIDGDGKQDEMRAHVDKWDENGKPVISKLQIDLNITMPIVANPYTDYEVTADNVTNIFIPDRITIDNTASSLDTQSTYSCRENLGQPLKEGTLSNPKWRGTFGTQNNWTQQVTIDGESRFIPSNFKIFLSRAKLLDGTMRTNVEGNQVEVGPVLNSDQLGTCNNK
ncbi:hypothetical protein K1X76_06175 [bacterium]|nr:hypothetical protein [bacterium]